MAFIGHLHVGTSKRQDGTRVASRRNLFVVTRSFNPPRLVNVPATAARCRRCSRSFNPARESRHEVLSNHRRRARRLAGRLQHQGRTDCSAARARRRRCHAGLRDRRLHRPGPRDGDHDRLHPLTMIRRALRSHHDRSASGIARTDLNLRRRSVAGGSSLARLGWGSAPRGPPRASGRPARYYRSERIQAARFVSVACRTRPGANSSVCLPSNAGKELFVADCRRLCDVCRRYAPLPVPGGDPGHRLRTKTFSCCGTMERWPSQSRIGKPT
jgi:hypothetical protein